MNQPPPNPAAAAEFQKAIVEKVSKLPKVLATIEGKDLPSSLYAEMLMKSLNPQQIPSFLSASEEDIKAHAKEFTQSEVNQVLIQLCASKDGYEGSADEVQEDFDKWHESLPEVERGKFENFLKEQNLNFDDYRKETGQNQVQQRRLATDRWVKEKAMVGIEVSQEDVEAAYEQGKDQNCTSPDMVKVAHIPFRHDQSDEKRKDCQERAEAVLVKLKEGVSFDEMVKENPSSDGHLKRMGILDFFSRGTYNEKFEKVAFSLEPGELSDLVETEEGFEIIKAIEFKKGEVTPLSQVEGEIREGLKKQKINIKIGELLEKQRSNFEITYHI